MAAVQWGLTCVDPGNEGLLPGVGLLSSWNQVRCCEQVCKRHLNGGIMREDAEMMCSCDWLDQSLPIGTLQGTANKSCLTAANYVRCLVEKSILHYISAVEMPANEGWEKMKLKWLEASCIFHDDS